MLRLLCPGGDGWDYQSDESTMNFFESVNLVNELTPVVLNYCQESDLQSARGATLPGFTCAKKLIVAVPVTNCVRPDDAFLSFGEASVVGSSDTSDVSSFSDIVDALFEDLTKRIVCLSWLSLINCD